MAHAIIFTDRAPVTRHWDNIGLTSAFYSFVAGPYKLASVLRAQGLDVLIVPNCLNLSFAGIKHIVDRNQKNLLWVGISTTFLTAKSSTINQYRNHWTSTSNHVINTDLMFESIESAAQITEMVWHTKEIGRMSHWLERTHQVPLLLGGAWVSRTKNGNLNHLHANTHVVKGYAETWISKFTQERLKDHNSEVPFLVDNSSYDDNDFKRSQILWNKHDHIESTDWLPLEVARGCAFNCHYCDYPRRSSFDSYKHPEALRQELIENYEKFGVTRYLLVDDLYNDSKEKVRVLYDKVWSRLPFKPEWSSYMRLDLFWADPESIDIVKASGARIGSFGIETLNDRAGKGVGKGLGKRRILETLEKIKTSWKSDVLVTANFIAGLPLEPLDSIKESMAWSSSTDLLFNYSWNPLAISPTDQLTIYDDRDTLHKITKDNDNYGITWPAKGNWLNSQGVTFAQVDQMCMDHMSKVPLGVKVGFTDYVDFRMAGMSHDEIVGIKNGTTSIRRLQDIALVVQQKIQRRLDRVLATEI